jgi:hypothetical protein
MAKGIESWRTREQVLIDLAKALHFSADALEQNRKGYLAVEQWQRLFVSFFRPLVLGAGYILAPFFIWALVGTFSGGRSLMDSINNVISLAFQPKQLFEDHGWFVCAVIIGVTFGGIGLGIHKLLRISWGLYFDLIERKVIIKDGRVEGREEQVFRTEGRDPIESYFFDMKTERFHVSCAAVQALDNGAAYLVYVLPRSRTLVAIEPKVSASDGIAVAS